MLLLLLLPTRHDRTRRESENGTSRCISRCLASDPRRLAQTGDGGRVCSPKERRHQPERLFSDAVALGVMGEAGPEVFVREENSRMELRLLRMHLRL